MFICQQCARLKLLGSSHPHGSWQKLASPFVLSLRPDSGAVLLAGLRANVHSKAAAASKSKKERAYDRSSDPTNGKQLIEFKNMPQPKNKGSERFKGAPRWVAKAESSQDAAVTNALFYQRDPYSIAKYVETVLEKGRYNEVLAVLQKASSQHMSVVVGWNHLISYDMKNGHVKRGFKAFNDMKKRHQVPNAQTYTAIFDGIAQLDNPKPHVAEVLRLYNIMKSSKRVPPNIVHVNCILHACARANDIESLFLVLGDVTEAGPMAPDSRTFTVAFNALRAHHQGSKFRSSDKNSLIDEKDRLAAIAESEKVAASIHRATLIWQDTVRRRKSGKLMMDENMICAYCRILMLDPTKQSCDGVFDILKDTLGIPSPSEINQVQLSAVNNVVPSNRFGAKPGSNTLSLLLLACELGQVAKSAVTYWNLLTGRPYNVTPDKENWHQYLRSLRSVHDSKRTAEAIVVMPPQFMAPKTFRIALSTCVRDHLNLTAFEHAGKILSVMSHVLVEPDPQALRIYLRAAQMIGRQEYKDGGERSMQSYATQLSRALDRLWDPMRLAWESAFATCTLTYASGEARDTIIAARQAELLHRLREETVSRTLKLGGNGASAAEDDVENMEVVDSAPDTDDKVMVKYNDQREVVALARQMLGAYDRVIDLRRPGPVGIDTQLMMERYKQLNRRVMRFFSERRTKEPNLRYAALDQATKASKRVDDSLYAVKRPDVETEPTGS